MVDTLSELNYTLEGDVKRYYRVGDTKPPICAALKRSDLIPITMADVSSITFSMRKYGDVYAIPKVNDQLCTTENSTHAQICYYWGATDLSSVGVYEGQFTVYYNSTVYDGSTLGATVTERFPTNIHLMVFVSESII